MTGMPPTWQRPTVWALFGSFFAVLAIGFLAGAGPSILMHATAAAFALFWLVAWLEDKRAARRPKN